ncbi:lipopolysaccharide biosynthesis protein [Oliverpabstia intestinalis]|uniref:lipopolysaccharide biosynthesis protein n=1 Tax=Oliverpabstia intestinalis TaxID=2606633 RepID=UPI003F899696
MASKQGVISNFIWRFAERCGAQGVKLIVELVLARILLPEDYGLIALVTVLIQILNVFVDSGLGNALIQKKDADDLDFSTVFYFNLVWCAILYGLLFLTAPIFASFYGQVELVPVLRVLGLQVIISGIKNVQQAYVSRTMQFKRFFYATLAGTLGAAVVGIFMAYQGFGVWALVCQQLFNVLVDTVVLWLTVKWRPKKMFSLDRLKVLFNYGWKLLASSLLDTIYAEIRQLIIGKLYSSSDLAFYNRGKQFPNLIVTNVNTSIDSVLLPTMSKEQDNKDRVKKMTRRSIQVSTYIMAPLMIGLACCASNIVTIVLTEKWLPCVFFLQIFCITYMFYPIHTANLNAIKAMGRSDLFLKLEIWKKVIGMILLLSTMFISVEAMAYSLLISTLTSMIINSWPNKKLLNYSFLEQMKDILPSILLALGMGMLVYLVGFLSLPTLFLLLIQVICGGVIYLLGSACLKLEPYVYLQGIIKPMIQKRRKV